MLVNLAIIDNSVKEIMVIVDNSLRNQHTQPGAAEAANGGVSGILRSQPSAAPTGACWQMAK
jgi:hypothetical protein